LKPASNFWNQLGLHAATKTDVTVFVFIAAAAPTQ